MNSVLYDAPGPRTRKINLAATVLAGAVMLWVAYWVWDRLDQSGQWESEKWKPFTEAPVWENFIIPGIGGTLRAFAVATVLALAFGFVFGVGRMSENRIIRLVSGAVVEFFRAIPLLLLIVFIYYAQSNMLDLRPASVYWAVVIGLVLYNGSVLAEVIRAGVLSLPRGQREAGLAIGLTPAAAMRIILLPQALRAMLPAVIAQLVVLLKDTALGFILAYDELLNQINKIAGNYQNLIPAAIVIGAIYIAMNLTLSGLATWLEGFMRRSRKSVDPVSLDDPKLIEA